MHTLHSTSSSLSDETRMGKVGSLDLPRALWWGDGNFEYADMVPSASTTSTFGLDVEKAGFTGVTKAAASSLLQPCMLFVSDLALLPFSGMSLLVYHPLRA